MYTSHTSATIEDADFRAVANPTNSIVLPVHATRGDVIEHLSKEIPQNEYGLPTYYIRSDLLDVEGIRHRGHLTYQEADGAAQILNYRDGYPTLSTGSPFWVRMPHEPDPVFVLFQKFLDLVEIEGIRLVDTLAMREELPVEQLRSHYQEFYWSSRARAYDLFIVAAEAKRKQALMRKAENQHYDVAGQILEKVIGRINDEPDLIDDMEAEDLFKLFEQMVKVQRVSLGLSGQNSSSIPRDLATPGQSVEFVLRSLTKNAGLTDTSVSGLQDRIGVMMSDPDTAMSMQELIIRATTDNQIPNSSPVLPQPQQQREINGSPPIIEQG